MIVNGELAATVVARSLRFVQRSHPTTTEDAGRHVPSGHHIGFAQQPAESYDRNAYLMLQGSLNRLRKTVENCGSPDKEAVMKILDEVQARHLSKK